MDNGFFVASAQFDTFSSPQEGEFTQAILRLVT
jgi:hypothetical protein